MNIGDTVILRAKVTDVKPNDGVVLVTALAGDFREHWFAMKELEVETPPQAEAASVPGTTHAVAEMPKKTEGQTLAPAGAPGAQNEAQDPKYLEAVDLVKKHGYSAEAAAKIVEQVGPAAILAQFGGAKEAKPATAAGLHPDASDEELKKAAPAGH